MKNEIHLDFCIWGYEDISHNDITEAIGIKPSKIYIKGQKSNSNFSIVSKQNGWRISSGIDKYASFEEHMSALTSIINNKLDVFELFTKKYYCEFSCAIYLYFNNEESTPSIHLDEKYHELYRKLKFDFDLDIYNLPND